MFDAPHPGAPRTINDARVDAATANTLEERPEDCDALAVNSRPKDHRCFRRRGGLDCTGQWPLWHGNSTVSFWPGRVIGECTRQLPFSQIPLAAVLLHFFSASSWIVVHCRRATFADDNPDQRQNYRICDG
jgi:hypothetical protein